MVICQCKIWLDGLLISNYKLINKMLLNYRKLIINDAEKIRIWRNNQIKILRQNKKIKKKDQIKYFKKNILSKNSKLDLFGIELNNKLIGYGGLVNISKSFKTAEVSLLIDSKLSHNSKLYENIFVHFLDYMKKYSFRDKKLRRLYTETFSFRKKHIKILEKCGFKLEGTLRNHVIKNKKLYNSLMHGILNK